VKIPTRWIIMSRLRIYWPSSASNRVRTITLAGKSTRSINLPSRSTGSKEQSNIFNTCRMIRPNTILFIATERKRWKTCFSSSQRSID